MQPELTHVLPVGNTLGEGVIWDTVGQCIWWTDIHEARLYRYDWRSGRTETRALPERLSAFALTADPNVLIAAFASGFARYDLERDRCEWLARPEAGYTGTRFNDGRVDRQGRFWCGTMVEGPTATDDSGKPVRGSLYCLQGGTAVRKLGDIRIPNSLCWNRAGDTLYFADTLEKTIWSFDFAAAEATLANRRTFARTRGSGPDGSCIDSDDCLWNAEWGGGRVTRYRPDGRVDLEVVLPVSQPTCVAFGGPDLDHLLVTSAKGELDDERLARQPQAGHLFIYRSGVRGVEENRVSSA